MEIAYDATFEQWLDAVKSQPRPRDWAYFGELDLTRWKAMPFGSQHRDSELIDRCNHETIWRDLEKHFPDAFVVERSSHWAVGWVEVIRGDTENKEAMEFAYDVWYKLTNEYPIYDEDYYSNKECEEQSDEAASFIEYDLARYVRENRDKYGALLNEDDELIPFNARQQEMLFNLVYDAISSYESAWKVNLSDLVESVKGKAA